MKLTDAMVYKLEHNLIREMDVFTASGDESDVDLDAVFCKYCGAKMMEG